MKQTERIEDFGRFLPTKASPESAMASRIERSIEPTVGTAIAGDLPETEGTTSEETLASRVRILLKLAAAAALIVVILLFSATEVDFVYTAF